MSNAARSVSTSCEVRRSKGGLVASKELGICIPRPGAGGLRIRQRQPNDSTGRILGLPSQVGLRVPEANVRREPGMNRSRSPVSVRGGAGCADAGLAAHILCVEAAAVGLGPYAAVQNRKQPDAGERDRD